jgi:hypothetical protein
LILKENLSFSPIDFEADLVARLHENLQAFSMAVRCLQNPRATKVQLKTAAAMPLAS